MAELRRAARGAGLNISQTLIARRRRARLSRSMVDPFIRMAAPVLWILYLRANILGSDVCSTSSRSKIGPAGCLKSARGNL